MMIDLQFLPRPEPSRSTTARRHRMRCNVKACRKRFTLACSPEYFKRPIRCPACGSAKIRSVEAERARELKKRITCGCPFYPFPHQRASLPMCAFNIRRLQGIEPTEAELQAWEQTLDTKRTTDCTGGDSPTEADILAAIPF